jgi:hypothetical protein
MKWLVTLMLAAMLDGSTVAAQHNNAHSSNDDVRQGPEASTFVLLGSGLVGLAIWFKKAKKQRK